MSTEERRHAVHFVAVNYADYARTDRFIRDLFAHHAASAWHIHLIDNTQPHDEAAAAQWPTDDARVHLHVPAHNLGYFNGLNAVYAQLAPRLSPRDWVVLSNVDLSFADATLEWFATTEASRFGVVAPRLIESGGKELNPFLLQRPTERFLTWRARIFEWRLLALAARATSSMRPSRQPDASPRRTGGARLIYAPHGACFAVGGRFTASTIDFSHDLLLYGEEVVLGERCRQAGIEVLYRPDLEVLHDAHASTALLDPRHRDLMQARAARHCRDVLYRAGW